MTHQNKVQKGEPREERTQYFDRSKVTIINGDTYSDNPNVSGYLTDQPDIRFEAKVFDVGSEYGIDQGRISKLTIMKGERPEHTELANYDRSWVEQPKSIQDKMHLRKILDAFPRVSEMTREQQAEWETDKEVQGMFEMHEGGRGPKKSLDI